jgi:hypothetical protein
MQISPQRHKGHEVRTILSPFCLCVLCVSVVTFFSVLVVVQRLRRVQLVPRLYMRIGQAERLPDQIQCDRHKPTYREIDEFPDTNISGVTWLGHARNPSNTRSAIANSK